MAVLHPTLVKPILEDERMSTFIPLSVNGGGAFSSIGTVAGLAHSARTQGG
jgi:hypothetical protein